MDISQYQKNTVFFVLNKHPIFCIFMKNAVKIEKFVHLTPPTT